MILSSLRDLITSKMIREPIMTEDLRANNPWSDITILKDLKWALQRESTHQFLALSNLRSKSNLTRKRTQLKISLKKEELNDLNLISLNFYVKNTTLIFSQEYDIVLIIYKNYLQFRVVIDNVSKVVHFKVSAIFVHVYLLKLLHDVVHV